MIFAPGPVLEQAADQILAALLPRTGQPPDDVTLLLAQIPPAPLACAAVMLEPEGRAVAAGRRFVSETLARWGYPGHAETASLLVSEIATNAVRYARAAIEVRVHRTAREIVTEISDDSSHLPQRRLPSPEEENGRGLMLVDALASSWGARPTESGKTVWFTLTIDPGQAERRRLGP